MKDSIQIDEKIAEIKENFNEKTKLLYKKIEQFNEDLSSIRNQYEGDIAKVRAEINSLKEQLTRLENVEASNVNTVEEEVIVNEEAGKEFPQIFTCDTLTSTEPLGFQNNKIKELYTDGIFKIKQISPESAEVRINDDVEVQKRVFGSLEDVISPACEILNLIQSPNKISTESPGILKLDKQNNIWIIKEKMKIKLIKNENIEY